MATFVQLGIENLLDELAKGNIEPDRLGIIVGILTDKMQVLTGEPTVIHGSAEGAKQFSVETLRARLGARREINVTATGSVGGENGQRREGSVGAADLAIAQGVT
jgi:hypothetical protein